MSLLSARNSHVARRLEYRRLFYRALVTAARERRPMKRRQSAPHLYLVAPAGSPSGSYVLRKCLSGGRAVPDVELQLTKYDEAPSRNGGIAVELSRVPPGCERITEVRRHPPQIPPPFGSATRRRVRRARSHVQRGCAIWYAAALCRRGNSGGSRRVSRGRLCRRSVASARATRTTRCCLPPLHPPVRPRRHRSALAGTWDRER